MPRRRNSLFTGELLPDMRGRGQSRGLPKRDAAESTRMCALLYAVALHLDGATRAAACSDAGDRFGLESETFRELFRVDVLDAATQILSDRVASRKLTREQAVNQHQALATRIGRNRSKKRR